MLSSIFLSSGLHFSLKTFSVSFAIFIPKYFIVFEAFVNGMFDLIFFLMCPLSVHRKATDICMLILYPPTLSKAFMISNGFW
jgi:hypothetical protein